MELDDLEISVNKLAEEVDEKILKLIGEDSMDSSHWTWRIQIDITDGYLEESANLYREGFFSDGEPKRFKWKNKCGHD